MQLQDLVLPTDQIESIVGGLDRMGDNEYIAKARRLLQAIPNILAEIRRLRKNKDVSTRPEVERIIEVKGVQTWIVPRHIGGCRVIEGGNQTWALFNGLHEFAPPPRAGRRRKHGLPTELCMVFRCNDPECKAELLVSVDDLARQLSK